MTFDAPKRTEPSWTLHREPHRYVPTLREESYLNYGTRLFSSSSGPCRARHLYPDKISAILGDKPLGALADIWFRRDADGRIWEWHKDTKVEVEVKE